MKNLTYLKYLIIALLISLSFCIDGDIHDFFLPNGLKVILMERHGAPKIAVNIAYNVGRHDEPINQQGINRIVHYSFSNMGTIKYPDGKVAKIRDEYDATYGDHSDVDISYLWTEIHKDGLEFVLDFESDRMINIIFDDKNIEEVKKRYITKWESIDKMQIQVNNSLSKLWEGHPYESGANPNPDSINKLNLESIRLWYETYYVPNNAVLTVVGNIDLQSTTKLIYQYLAHLESVNTIPADPDLSLELINSNSNIITNISVPSFSMYVNIAATTISFPSSRDSDFAILDNIAGIIRLSYSQETALADKFTDNGKIALGMGVDIDKRLGFSSLFFISGAPFKTISIKKLHNQIYKTFMHISENGIEEETLNYYKKHQLLQEYKNHYSFSKIAKNIAYSELVLGDYKYYNRKMETLKKLSNDQIKQTIKKYISEDEFRTVSMLLNKKMWNFPVLGFIINTFFKDVF